MRVVMYTTQWCPVCAYARSWFHARGIPFDEVDVERDPGGAARHRRLNAARTVPTLDVEGRVVIGFDADYVRRVIDEAAHRYEPLSAGGESASDVEAPAAPDARDEAEPESEAEIESGAELEPESGAEPASVAESEPGAESEPDAASSE